MNSGTLSDTSSCPGCIILLKIAMAGRTTEICGASKGTLRVMLRPYHINLLLLGPKFFKSEKFIFQYMFSLLDLVFVLIKRQ